MVDADGVAVLHRVEKLKEYALGKQIIADVAGVLGDVAKQVALWAVLEHDEVCVGSLDDVDEGDHIRMRAGQLVQSDLLLEKLRLARREADFVQSLDGIADARGEVLSDVDSAVGTDA